ncbi:MAG: hypothetical protein WBC33_09030 [Conexibacter sp.]
MGLFGADKRALREALDSLRVSIGFNAFSHAGPGDAKPVREKVAEVEAAVARLKAKGKTAEVASIIHESSAQKPPVTVLGGGPEAIAELNRVHDLWEQDGELPPVTGSGTSAQAELERREKLERLRAADAYWKATLHRISGGLDSGQG